MKQNTPTYNRLVANLHGFHRKEKILTALQNFFLLLSSAVPIIFLFVLVLAIFDFSPASRLVCFIFLLFVLLGLSFIFLGRVGRSLWSLFRPDMIAIARKVGGFYKDIDDRLVNSLQLYENFERDKEKFSVDLVEAALVKIGHLLEHEKFSAIVAISHLKRAGRNLAFVLVLFVVPLLAFRAFFSPGFFRLLHPIHNFEDKTKITFIVEPGEAHVIKGENLPVKVWISDTTATSLSLHLNNLAGEQELVLNKSTTDTFFYTIPNIRDTLQYSFSLKDQRSPAYSIFPVEHPFLRSLKIRVQPPRYAEMEAYFLDENIGDISALKGSKIQLSGLANKNLHSGQVVFSDGRKKEVLLQGRRFSSEFDILRDDSYAILLADEAGYENVSPITYKISLIPDNLPMVQILIPGKDIDLGDDMTIPLAIEAEDDYGISQLRLAYQLIAGGDGDLDSTRFVYSPITGFTYGDDQLRIVLNWDLAHVDMFPTDVLAYFVDVFDNDEISGPKSSRSEIYRARFPSLYEMYEEMATNQEEMTTSFEKTLDKTRDLQQKLDELALEMKRTTEMNWQQKQEIEEAAQQQQAIEKQIEAVTQQLDEMIEKIEKNDLFTKETIKKFQEIQQLYQEIMTPELQEAMQQMAEAMQNLDEEKVRQAMEKMKLNAEDYNKTLDRTISLLKKLKAEQKLDQALKMAQDLAKRQSDITENSQKPNSDETRLQKEQERINKDAKALSDLLSELQQDSKEIPSMPEEQINDAAAEMQSQNLQENLNDLQNMMAQKQMANVPQKSSQTQQSFEKIASSLDKAQQMMSGDMQRQAMQAMRKSSRELLQLSKQQEQLLQQTRNLPRNSPEYPEMANDQQEISSGLERVVNEMSQVMKDNFGIDPQVSRSLGKAMANMEKALSEMESREADKASQSQAISMSEINSAIRQMQQSMQNMQQQGSGSGMSYQQFLQQMQQMGDAQSQINQQSQGMSSGGPLSLGQQAAMARLAAEQRQVRKSMEQLAQEAEGLSEVLGSLDNIAEDMKKVEQDFNTSTITRDTINRQNRILSRMLDAQKSVHQREFSRERQAETGKNYFTTSPNALPADLGERKNQLQQDLLRAKKEGYSRDYIEVIEKYFKALTEYEVIKE